MSIKSTVTLTRDQAVQRLVDNFRNDQFIYVLLELWPDEALENALEKLDESRGDIFTNYLITQKEPRHE